jgi:hypothetical protein
LTAKKDFTSYTTSIDEGTAVRGGETLMSLSLKSFKIKYIILKLVPAGRKPIGYGIIKN